MFWCFWTSQLRFHWVRTRDDADNVCLGRFAINDSAVDWDTAAAQVKNLEKGGHGVSTIVSLKSTSSGDGAGGVKRKAPSAQDESLSSGAGAGKKNRRSKKVKR